MLDNLADNVDFYDARSPLQSPAADRQEKERILAEMDERVSHRHAQIAAQYNQAKTIEKQSSPRWNVNFITDFSPKMTIGMITIL